MKKFLLLLISFLGLTLANSTFASGPTNTLYLTGAFGSPPPFTASGYISYGVAHSSYFAEGNTNTGAFSASFVYTELATNANVPFVIYDFASGSLQGFNLTFNSSGSTTVAGSIRLKVFSSAGTTVGDFSLITPFSSMNDGKFHTYTIRKDSIGYFNMVIDGVVYPFNQASPFTLPTVGNTTLLKANYANQYGKNVRLYSSYISDNDALQIYYCDSGNSLCSNPDKTGIDTIGYIPLGIINGQYWYITSDLSKWHDFLIYALLMPLIGLYAFWRLFKWFVGSR